MRFILTYFYVTCIFMTTVFFATFLHQAFNTRSFNTWFLELQNTFNGKMFEPNKQIKMLKILLVIISFRKDIYFHA